MSYKSKTQVNLATAGEAMRIGAILRQRFARYRVENLQGVSPEEFQNKIESVLGSIDTEAEGYSEGDLDRQRDLSIKFHWGHDHDFGAFQVAGRMQDRHISLMTAFIELFAVDVEEFADADVFDIGCWTGGTALLLAALGARVFAIEEVRRYGDMARYLAHSFGLQDRVQVESRSLYSCNDSALHDRFDIAYFPGVIYHLSDPLLAFRIIFNSLRSGGRVLVETEGLRHPEPLCEFQGSQVYLTGNREELNRGGWNWFIPSPSALERMMREAGFEDVQCAWYEPTGRLFAYGRKLAPVGICRAGLSVPDIK